MSAPTRGTPSRLNCRISGYRGRVVPGYRDSSWTDGPAGQVLASPSLPDGQEPTVLSTCPNAWGQQSSPEPDILRSRMCDHDLILETGALQM